MKQACLPMLWKTRDPQAYGVERIPNQRNFPKKVELEKNNKKANSPLLSILQMLFSVCSTCPQRCRNECHYIYELRDRTHNKRRRSKMFPGSTSRNPACLQTVCNKLMASCSVGTPAERSAPHVVKNPHSWGAPGYFERV